MSGIKQMSILKSKKFEKLDGLILKAIQYGRNITRYKTMITIIISQVILKSASGEKTKFHSKFSY